jgi:peroxiredoxin Q/BCP
MATGACASEHALAPGDRVPEVGAHNQDGVAVRLSQYRGHPLVVYFYPKDRTSGCTIEAQAFRTEYPKFRALGAEIVGISHDDAASHKDFCNQQSLPFPLLADTDQSIAHAFHVGSILGFDHRITFLVDANGIVRHVFDPVHPASHAREVLTAVEGLTKHAGP